MNHYWCLPGAIFGNVFSAESPGHGKIYLNGSTLPAPTDGVSQDELILRSVEGALSCLNGVSDTFVVQRVCQHLFRPVPQRIFPNSLFGASGKRHLYVVETKVSVHPVGQLDQSRHLLY